MNTELSFTFKEMECLVDALAHLRRDESEMRVMGHGAADISELRMRIRLAMADHPQFKF